MPSRHPQRTYVHACHTPNKRRLIIKKGVGGVGGLRLVRACLVVFNIGFLLRLLVFAWVFLRIVASGFLLYRPRGQECWRYLCRRQSPAGMPKGRNASAAFPVKARSKKCTCMKYKMHIFAREGSRFFADSSQFRQCDRKKMRFFSGKGWKKR